MKYNLFSVFALYCIGVNFMCWCFSYVPLTDNCA